MTSVLIFSRTKRFADQLANILRDNHIRAAIFHGDRSQDQRMRALEQFKRGRLSVMVATV